jgi:redox-sensitive bicupin YhaK (pirin superfamily)
MSSTTRPSVLATMPLGFVWQTFDPFLFCVHHLDRFPPGNEALGPAVSLAGRPLGQDFEPRDGFRMYHGETVPGFPQHPHRGFETVTLARRGLIDHSDSLGATARFGRGDVQWMTAGRGIVHCEMFPLLERDAENPAELFQIWLNLPAKSKMVEPHFTMLWGSTIPRVEHHDGAGKRTTLTVVAGALPGLSDERPPSPPPASWASAPEHEVAIVTLELEPGARVTLPPASAEVNRTLYFFEGASLRVGERTLGPKTGARVRPDVALELENGPERSEALLLQGRPIGEPVVAHGPFVMNTRAEIMTAFSDYQRTRFGGWPWPKDDPVHPRERGRFARHADGRLEEPGDA